MAGSIASNNAPEGHHIELVRAADLANKDGVRRTLDGHAWTTPRDREALRQALRKAVLRGSVEVTELLLDKGADVEPNKKPHRPNDPVLFRAAEAGHLEIVKKLLEHNANPNTAANLCFDQTPLFPACLRGHVEIVAALLQRGADVHVQETNEKRRTPLLYMLSEVNTKDKAKDKAKDEAKPKAQAKVQAKVQAKIRVKDEFEGEFKGEVKDEVKDEFKGEVKDEVKGEVKGEAKDEAKDKARAQAKAKIEDERMLKTTRLLLENGADVEARDSIGRTALMWAAASGHLTVAKALLDGSIAGIKADITAKNKRGRGALHLAAAGARPAGDYTAMVKLLLEYGADPNATSHGGWTPLLIAAEKGDKNIVSHLLDRDADVNFKLPNRMTALHWAARNGHVPVVDRLLQCRKTNLTIRDSLGRTPLIYAAEGANSSENEGTKNCFTSIMEKLSPAKVADRLSEHAKTACQSFFATIVDFHNGKQGKQNVFRRSVYDALYGGDKIHKDLKSQPSFRWIHLPANNIAWAETLLTKWFLEDGHRDVEAFKALVKCFDREHRGPLPHAHFLRTLCQRIPGTLSQDPSIPEKKTEMPPPPATLSTTSTAVDPVPTNSNEGGRGGGGGGLATAAQQAQGASNGRPPSKRKNKGEKGEKREPLADPNGSKGGNGHANNPPSTRAGVKTPSQKKPSIVWSEANKNGKLVLFMPFLHYETDRRRQEMRSSVQRALDGRPLPTEIRDAMQEAPDAEARDQKTTGYDYMERALVENRHDLLVESYIRNKPPLHPRRTLDQFFYHSIDTTTRDQDQVVSRYCLKNKMEVKVFMVDQLWLWVLGTDLVITCFPELWNQKSEDPLIVVDGVIEDVNAKTRPPIQSVYELAVLIANRCSGLFDRHSLPDQSFQFLDMFESSIGDVANKESNLFSRFNMASTTVLGLLRPPSRRMTGSLSNASPSQSIAQNIAESLDKPQRDATDALLNIDEETKLLTEVKDIRDELNILDSILQSQAKTLEALADSLSEELRSGSSRAPRRGGARRTMGAGNSILAGPNAVPSVDKVVAEIRKRTSEHQRDVLDIQKSDISRMNGQTNDIYTGLTHLLDLKQKHSNALEARFARDHAMIAARQGKTIMTFTIVTILFLPMSFIAAFFSMQLEWGHVLTVGYVSRYMFGIGLGISVPLIILAVALADISISSTVQTFSGNVRNGGAQWYAPWRRQGGGAAARKQADLTLGGGEDMAAAGAPAVYGVGSDRGSALAIDKEKAVGSSGGHRRFPWSGVTTGGRRGSAGGGTPHDGSLCEDLKLRSVSTHPRQNQLQLPELILPGGPAGEPRRGSGSVPGLDDGYGSISHHRTYSGGSSTRPRWTSLDRDLERGT